MFSSLLAAGADLLASEEGSHQLELLGMPTYWFALIGFVIFGLLMAVTVSFSGRGLVRPDKAGSGLAAHEQEALKEYKSRHKR